jgi:hypothetical protein
MDSRQRVRKTLEFDSPDRAPHDLWTLPWAYDHYPVELARIQSDFPNDIVTAPCFCRETALTQGNAYEVGNYVDEWGCRFINIQKGVIGEVKEPLVKDWSDLERLRPPLESLTLEVDKVNDYCRQTDRFVLAGCCPRPFERLQFIRKSENLYMDLGEQPSELYELIQRVHQHYMKELELWATTEVDAMMFMDDWGGQRALLISPAMWRRIFKPLYKEYIDLAHSKGKKIFMHSDGYIQDILPDLVELGLDAVNSQLFVMDIEGIGKRLGGQITFWGEIDRQHMLPNGTLADIDAAVRRVKNAVYRNGGAIAQCEFGAGARPENVYQVFQSWDEATSGNRTPGIGN